LADERARDIWSHGSGVSLRDLLQSVLATLLVGADDVRPVYFASPWISNFLLFDNYLQEFSVLFPASDYPNRLDFIDYLGCLSGFREVRLITTDNSTTRKFAKELSDRSVDLELRLATDEFHEKGICCPEFYIEGSMNITYSGVYVRGEKIAYHSDTTGSGKAKASRAMIEIERFWSSLTSVE